MNDASALRSKGISALLSGSLVAAQELLSRAVDLSPFDAIARHDLALVARLRGAIRLAIEQSASAAALGHEQPAVLAAILAQHALHARLIGRDHDARSAIDRAIEAHPEHAVSWYYRGLFARLDGDVDRSVDDLRRALVLARASLPPLVRSRIEGMIADARATVGARAAPIRAASMIAAISEPILSDATPATLDTDVASEGSEEEARTVMGREITAASAARALHEARSITVITGAGCSAASGLSTRKELWRRFDKDAIVTATHNDLRSLWLVVLDFIGGRRPAPNAAHDVIAALPRVRAIVTQNVDELHQRAQRPEREPPIIELHGTLERLRCGRCGESDPRTAREVVESEAHGLPPLCARCKSRAVRPDVVLFGEWVDSELLARAAAHVAASDVVLVVGCAMDVAPASELPRIAVERGATVIEVKRGPSRLSRSIATNLVRGPCEDVLPAIYAELARLEPLAALPARPAPLERAPVQWNVRAVPIGESVGALSMGEPLVREGARVSTGQPILWLDCDKVTVEVDAPIDGTLVRVSLANAQPAPVGAVLATIAPTPESEVARRTRAVREELSSDAASLVAPIVRSFGAHTAALRALFELIANGRWLHPDAALATMNDEARSWLDDRADELRAALALDERALSLRVFRDGFEAFDAASRAWTESLRASVAAREAATPPWIEALDAAGAALSTGDSAEKALSAAAATAVAAACRTSRAWAGAAIDPAPSSLYALASLAAKQLATKGAAHSDGAAFRVLLALWLRGAWPFALPEGLGVWVPLFEDGAIVPNPSAAQRSERARWPEHPKGSPACPRPVGHGLSALWAPPRAR